MVDMQVRLNHMFTETGCSSPSGSSPPSALGVRSDEEEIGGDGGSGGLGKRPFTQICFTAFIKEPRSKRRLDVPPLHLLLAPLRRQGMQMRMQQNRQFKRRLTADRYLSGTFTMTASQRTWLSSSRSVNHQSCRLADKGHGFPCGVQPSTPNNPCGHVIIPHLHLSLFQHRNTSSSCFSPSELWDGDKGDNSDRQRGAFQGIPLVLFVSLYLLVM